MNFLQLQDQVLDYLDWGTGDDMRNRAKDWINMARLDIARAYDFEFLFTESTITTTSGEDTYPWPCDILDHLTIFLDDASGNKIIIFEMTRGYYGRRFHVPDASDPVEAPYHIIRKGTEFEIYPDPPAGRAVTLWYYAAPTDFSEDTDNDYMSTIYEEAIMWGAVYRGAIYADDEEKKAVAKENYQQSVQQMIGRETRKKMPKQIRMKTWRDIDIDVWKKEKEIY